MKSKRLLSIFLDFIFMLIIILITLTIIFFMEKILYPEESYTGEIKIRTELMPSELEAEIYEGQALYDTLTKRKIGTVSNFEVKRDGDKIYFLITAELTAMPRGKSLRTRDLWFYFANAGVNDS